MKFFVNKFKNNIFNIAIIKKNDITIFSSFDNALSFDKTSLFDKELFVIEFFIDFNLKININYNFKN